MILTLALNKAAAPRTSTLRGTLHTLLFVVAAFATGVTTAASEGVPHSRATGSDDSVYGRYLAATADAAFNGYGDVAVELQMLLVDSGGETTERLLSIRQLEVPADGDKLLVVFSTPKAIKGTALLSHAHKVGQDDQWLFLPAIKRVKKIASKNRSGPFLSSEFSFEDLTPQEVEKYQYKYLREAACGAQQCYIVERIPLDQHSGYSRQEVWFDQVHLRTIRIDFFDRRLQLQKTLEASDFQLYQDSLWRAHKMHMHNVQTGKGTTLVWSQYQFANGFTAERDFSTNSLRRVR